MDSFLRDSVDLAGFAGGAIAGDAHFFEDASSPAKIKAYLDSNQVEHGKIIVSSTETKMSHAIA